MDSLVRLSKQEKVLEAVIKTSILNVFARFFGYLKNMSIAVILGFNYQTDGFFMALSLMGLFLIFADVFDSIGVPQLVKARLESEEAFKKLSGLLFSFTLFLSFCSFLLSILLLQVILKIPKGFSYEALKATKESYLLLIPYMSLSFIFHHFGAVLRSQRRFTAYFFGEFIFSLVTFLIITIALWKTKDYRFLALATSIAQIVSTLYILYIGRNFIHIGFYYDRETKKMLFHFFQLSLLYGVFHLYILVDRAFASHLEEKAVSALTYGLTIAGALKGILKFENIAITSLSEVRGDIAKLNFYLKKLFLITLPISFFLFLFPWLPIKILFGYGAFSKMDMELTSIALKYYALSIPFMFIWPLIYRVFQIREKLWFIGFIALSGVLINGGLNYIFIFILNLGIKGICLGTFLANLFICVFGYLRLLRIN